MGLLDKVKGLVSGNKRAIKGGIGKAADLIESKTPDSVDDKVEMASKKANDAVNDL